MMMKVLKYIPVITFLTACSVFVAAQEEKKETDWMLYPNKETQTPASPAMGKSQNTNTIDSNVTLVEDARIQALLEKETRINKEKGTIPGYRVQLFYGSGPESRSKAKAVQADFLKQYTDTPAYLMFQSPNFKIRVGDFRNRMEAEKFLRGIRPDFENAFIVKDEIELPPLEVE